MKRVWWLGVVAVLAVPFVAIGDDTYISELTEETSPGATDVLIIEGASGAVTQQVTVANLLDGELLKDDSIDDDSIDFGDVTGVDLTLTDCGAVTSSGSVTATTSVITPLLDATGAVDMDYGSVDITDHTFTTNDSTLVIDGGITVSTGDTITLGTTAWNSGDSIDGEQIAANTIDEDSVDWGTGTDQISCVDMTTTDCGAITSTGAVGGTDLTASDDIIGQDDLQLDSDSALIQLGEDQDVSITHVADTGIVIKQEGLTTDDHPMKITLQTGEVDMAASDVIGGIYFQAPDEGTGTDAILIAAGIEAVSEGNFSSTNNATKLSFQTGASEAAAEKMSLSSAGVLTITSDLTVTGGDITLGTTSIFSGGDTASLNNIDALNATTETTIEAALDTLANVTSVGTLTSLACGIITTSGNPHIDGTDPSVEFDETDGTDWELRVDDTGNSFEIGSSIAAVGDNVELEIDEDGDLHVTGDVYVTGDDLFMNTNTDGYVLVADGTNFNPTQQVETVYIPVGDMDITDGGADPASSLHATATNSREIKIATFDGGTDEDLTFPWVVPSNISGLTVKVRWIGIVTHATGPSNEVISFQVSGASIADGAQIDIASFGSVVAVTEAAVTDEQDDIITSAWSSVITPTSLGAGEVALFLINRDADDVDTYAQDFGLIGVEIKYLVDMATLTW